MLSAWLLPFLWQHLGQSGFGHGLWQALDGPEVISGQRINTTQWGTVAGFLITPYALQYDYILMAMTVVALWRATVTLRSWRLLAAAALWLAFYTIHLWAHWMNEMYWMPLILLGLAVISSARWNDP